MISQLELFNFRNFSGCKFDFSSDINLITGANGSGKSSILEAIFYLARGRSFRSSSAELMIKNSEKDFTIRAVLENNTILASSRNTAGKTKHKLNGELCNTMLSISEQLPVLFLDTNSQRWLAAGPKNRRQLLDWGLFYGRKEEFFNVWRNFRRVLLQRNAAIKACGNFSYWDELFIEMASKLDLMRAQYVLDLELEFKKVWHSCELAKTWGEVRFKYAPGYTGSLAEALASSGERDRKLGHTSIGPHRADLLINIGNKPAHLLLSQGQQKLLTYTLAITQANLHLQDTQANCIFLLDDVFAELDLNIRATIVELLKTGNNQTILTGIVADEIKQTLTANTEISLGDIQQAK